MNLGLKDRKDDPPSYLQLLQMVRREEAEQREKLVCRGGRNPQVAPAPKPVPVKSLSHSVEKPNRQRFGERPRFCYSCGQEGHFKSKCPNGEDLKKVNQQLISFLQGNAKGRLTGASQEPTSKQ